MECRMSKKQKSGWQELWEEARKTSLRRLFAQVVWTIFFIVGIFVLHPYIGIFFDNGHNLEARRNFVLIASAFLALPLAIHRTVIADKQLRESEKQNRDRDFQNWIVNFFSSNEGMRYVATEELWHFAQKYPEYYHVKVMRLFCNFIRNYSDCDGTTSYGIVFSKKEKENHLRDDQIDNEIARLKFTGEKHFNNILSMVINKGGHLKNTAQILQERDEGYRIDLSDTNFVSVDLSGGDLTNADLRWTFWSFENRGDINIHDMKWDNCYIEGAFFNVTGLVADLDGLINDFKKIKGKPISTPNAQEIYVSNEEVKFLDKLYETKSSLMDSHVWMTLRREKPRILPTLPTLPEMTFTEVLSIIRKSSS